APADAGAAAADDGGCGQDAAEADGADPRRRRRHARVLSGVSARPERGRRTGMVEIGAAMTAADWPYPAPADDGAADHLTLGLVVPDIELPSTDGGAVSLARLDKGAVVFIYPWTGRPGLPNPPGWDEIPGAHGSTPQALGFQDLLPE